MSVIRNLGNLLKYGKRVPVVKSAVDVITNPNTYQMISNQADDVLQRILPGKFQGIGIQNAPINLIGDLNDISRMAPGSAKEAARNQLQRNFRMAGRLDDTVRPTGGQTSTGALRAPTIPGTTRTYDLVNPRGIRATSGPPVANLNSIFQGPALPGGTTVGATLGAAGAGLLGLPSGPGAFVTGLAGGYAGYEAGTGLYDTLKPNFMDFIQNPARMGGMPGAGTLGTPDTSPKPRPGTAVDSNPQQGADIDMDAIRRTAATAEARNKYQTPPVGLTPNYQLDSQARVQPPSVETPPNTPTVIPGTSIPQTPSVAARPYAPADNSGNIGATYGNGTSTMPHANVANTVLPPNAEQILQADPMQLYTQARNAAVGQDQSAMNKVRDLGLAIHRQKFPGMYASENTLPGSMTAKDESEALTEIEPSQIDQALLGIYSGNQPVLDPNKFLQLQLSGRVAR